tara:strand:+ start:2144 stop:2725 length:582 start_codon:yes stop_codon:yes gene_type:complete
VKITKQELHKMVLEELEEIRLGSYDNRGWGKDIPDMTPDKEEKSSVEKRLDDLDDRIDTIMYTMKQIQNRMEGPLEENPKRTAKGNITQDTREKYATVGDDKFPIFDKKSAEAAIDLRGHAPEADRKKIINKAAKYAPEAAKKAREADMNEAVITEEDENNPWAICTASVGREDKEKYEKCVMSVKAQNKEKK